MKQAEFLNPLIEVAIHKLNSCTYRSYNTLRKYFIQVNNVLHIQHIFISFILHISNGIKIETTFKLSKKIRISV